MTSRIEESGVATFLIRFKDKNENYGWSSRIQDCNLKPELTAGYIQQRNKAIWNLISLKENMIHLPLPNFILLINYSPCTNRLFHFFYLLWFFFLTTRPSSLLFIKRKCEIWNISNTNIQNKYLLSHLNYMFELKRKYIMVKL